MRRGWRRQIYFYGFSKDVVGVIIVEHEELGVPVLDGMMNRPVWSENILSVWSGSETAAYIHDVFVDWTGARLEKHQWPFWQWLEWPLSASWIDDYFGTGPCGPWWWR
jgi:hypothetical protein